MITGYEKLDFTCVDIGLAALGEYTCILIVSSKTKGL